MMNQEQMDFIVRNAVASQAFEGLHPTEAEVATAYAILRGETTAEREIAIVVQKGREQSSG